MESKKAVFSLSRHCECRAILLRQGVVVFCALRLYEVLGIRMEILIIIVLVIVAVIVYVNLPYVKKRARQRADKQREKQKNCNHKNLVQIGTKTVSYGAGFNKKTYPLYKCNDCGKEM